MKSGYACITFAALLALTAGPVSAQDDDLDITPYRPSVSTPAQLPKPRQLELEFGGLASKTAGTRRDSLPYQFKYAFTKEWGVLLGGDAFVAAEGVSGERIRGIGDTTVVLKRAFLVDDATAFGLELSAKAPTAKDTIGSGKADYGINGIFSRDLGKIHLDANLNFIRMGEVDPGTERVQTGLSTAFSVKLGQKWEAVAELSGTRRGGVPSTAQWLAALSYNLSRRMQIDFGVAKGLNDASPDWSLFGGIVIPVVKF